MRSATIRVASSAGGDFACHVVQPAGTSRVPAIVLGSAIHGVDDDLLEIAAAFAAAGFLAAAPDLFWRSIPGALSRGDPRAAERARPRREKIAMGERDFLDVRAALDGLARFDGRAAVMGFCYAGPYAVLGPKRLGYDAGIACHGTQMGDFVGDLEGIASPVRILWGDRDELAPPEVRLAYRAVAARDDHVRVREFHGVRHGYMMRGSGGAFDPAAREASMDQAFEVLRALAAG